MRMAPFHALRYNPDVAGPPSETSAPPYDRFDGVRYIRHRTSNPYTVLQLMAGTVRDPTGGAAGRDDDYRTASATLTRWRRTGVVTEDPHPAMYVYEEHELRRGVPALQRGIVATLDLADIDDGHLLLHEDVDENRVAMRQSRMLQVPVDLTPVVAIHVVGIPAAGQLVDAARRHRPVCAFTDEGQIDHRIWRIADPQALSGLAAAFAGVTAVLADGHHRVAAAQRIRAQLLRDGQPLGRWGKITVWIVDAVDHGPELNAVHRLVHGLPHVETDGTPTIEGFRSLRWIDSIPALERAVAALPGLAFGVVTSSGSWVLQAIDPDAIRGQLTHLAPPLRQLDVTVATQLIVAEFADTGSVEEVVDLGPALTRITSGTPDTLLLLRPPTAEQVHAVAAAGLRMPSKTTWFRPKPRAGLLMRALAGPAVESSNR